MKRQKVKLPPIDIEHDVFIGYSDEHDYFWEKEGPGMMVYDNPEQVEDLWGGPDNKVVRLIILFGGYVNRPK